jgi:hypothetical protein
LGENSASSRRRCDAMPLLLESDMTPAELSKIFTSPEFNRDLGELSSYLASIMQERPIVYLLAKHLWKQGYKFELENKRRDLFVNDKRLEFKFNYDKMEIPLKDELARWENLEKMWAAVQARHISKSWGVMARIYEDVCIKKPDIFVWIICSRDLSKLAANDLKRIAAYGDQRKYNAERPYDSKGGFLATADLFLERLQGIERFSVLKAEAVVNGDFPSTYHFRICEFPKKV